MYLKRIFKRLFFNLMYIRNPTWDSGIPAPELMEYIRKCPPGRALDLGCGTGTNMKALLQADWEVDGVDFAWLAIYAARRKVIPFGEKGRVFHGSVVDLQFLKEKYDLILDIGCFHALSQNERQSYIRNVRRLLNFNGTLLLYVFLKSAKRSMGIDDIDILQLSNELNQVDRRNGFDRHEQMSVWLEYKMESNPD